MLDVAEWRREVAAVWTPPPKLTVSEWADARRQLSREASAEPGQWSTSRAEYQRGIMDAISDPLVHTVVVMSSSQVGKSEMLLNGIGFYMEQDPAPILFLQPTIEMAETFAKDRIATMLRDTPCLSGLVAEARSKDSANTILHKQFPGGHLTLAGANSPASLASRPVRLVFCDEVDRYPPSAGSEGDPVTLAKARTKTFWNRKMVLTSTPTISGASRIEQAYEESDQRVFEVPCPHCAHRQRMMWAQVRWDEGAPDTAAYYCASCGAAWTDAQRWAAIRRGEWAARRPFRGVAGFHLSELYSPWAHVADVARACLDASASRSVERIRAWKNTALGECWEPDSEKVDDTGLAARVETWESEPEGVLAKTVGVDVQVDRVELELVGWSEHHESWSLDYHVIAGDPSGPALWADLDAYLTTAMPDAVCIDSGYMTETVYDFCRPRYRRRVFAIKGVSGPGRPVWPKRASRGAAGKARFFSIGVDAAKDQIFQHFRLATTGPGYCHFPAGRDERYFAGLASEVVEVKRRKGFQFREYKKLPGVRNEPLDCRVYAYAALRAITVDWKARRAAKQAPPRREQAQSDQPADPAPTVKPPAWIAPTRRGGFVRGWR
jgi:phage terminase large subunit GpA-like protein